MKNEKKKGAREASRPPLVVFVLCALVLAGIGIWIFEALSSPSPAPPAVAAQTVSTPAVWTPLVSQQHGFSVSLPAPAQNLSAVASGIDTGPESSWAATYSGGTVMVKVIRCPEKLCRQVPDTLLEGARKGALEELGGALVREQRLEIPCPQGTCRGLEFEANARQGFRVSARFFVTHNKIFQVMSTQSSASNDVFKKVMDSFTFL